MKDQKLRAREFLLRTARVKQMRAAAALVQAAQDEQARQASRDSVEASRDLVVQAGRACVASSGALDINRYALLSELGLALQQQLHEASRHLAEATEVREQCAEDSVFAKRYYEKADERAAEYRLTMHRLHAAKGEEDAIELWIEGRDRS